MTALFGLMSLVACSEPNDEASGGGADALREDGDYVDAHLTFRTASDPCVWSEPLNRQRMTFDIDAWEGTDIPAGGTVPTLIVLDERGKLVGQGQGGIMIGADGGVYFSGWNFATWSEEYHSLVATGDASSFRIGTFNGDVKKLVPGQEVAFQLAGDYAYKRSLNSGRIVIVGTKQLQAQTFTAIKVPADARWPNLKFTGHCSADNGE